MLDAGGDAVGGLRLATRIVDAFLGQLMHGVGGFAHLLGHCIDLADQLAGVVRHGEQRVLEDVDLVAARPVAGAQIHLQVALAKAHDLARQHMQPAQALPHEEEDEEADEQGRDDAGHDQQVAQAIAQVEVLVAPAAGCDDPAPARTAGVADQFFAQTLVGIGQQVLLCAVAPFNHFGQAAQRAFGEIALGQGFALARRVEDELGDVGLAQRAQDIDIPRLARDEALEEGSDLLQLVVQRDAHRQRAIHLAIRRTQLFDNAEVVRAVADRQAAIIAAFEDCLGHRIVVRNAGAIHRLAVALEQGRRAVKLAVLDRQKRRLVARHLTEGRQFAIAPIDEFAADADRRQIDFARAHGFATERDRPADPLGEQTQLPFGTLFDVAVKGIQRAGHDLGLLLQGPAGFVDQGFFRLPQNAPGQGQKDTKQEDRYDENDLRSKRKVAQTHNVPFIGKPRQCDELSSVLTPNRGNANRRLDQPRFRRASAV